MLHGTDVKDDQMGDTDTETESDIDIKICNPSVTSRPGNRVLL